MFTTLHNMDFKIITPKQEIYMLLLISQFLSKSNVGCYGKQYPWLHKFDIRSTLYLFCSLCQNIFVPNIKMNRYSYLHFIGLCTSVVSKVHKKTIFDQRCYADMGCYGLNIGLLKYMFIYHIICQMQLK